MSKPSFHILIIGGGIGGLCLAQGLRQKGMSVVVYERDRTPDARLQGYRLNIEPVGSSALHACLPTNLWNLLVATAGDPGPRMGVFDEQLRELMQEDEQGAVDDPARAHHAVSRVTLRRLLLVGLDDVVQFDKQFTHYEQSASGKVTAFFADGTSATGDVLVGADGARSRVRRQLLPAAREIDTLAVGVGGKLSITPETTAWLPMHMMTTKNMILPPQDFLFTAAFRRRKTSSGLAHEMGDRLSGIGFGLEELLNETEDDYVMWAFVGHRHTFPSSLADNGQLALRQLIEERMTGWHPTIRRLVSETDPATVEAFDFSAAATVKPWTSTNVTLLGDALHYMPPVGGMGGNAALHDASLLCAALTAVNNNELPLSQALRAFEPAMISHGFGAVHASLLYTKLAISRFRPLRSVARMFFRVCGFIPPLRRMVFRPS
jgi:2-polyprenyl-6-methoxyphenol hydroxylase-like FAD-dependent oxidoreductase